MSTKTAFLAEIDAFLERSKMTASAFGKAAVNDPNFVGDIRGDRQPSLGLVDRVHAFIQQQDAVSKEAAQ